MNIRTEKILQIECSKYLKTLHLEQFLVRTYSEKLTKKRHYTCINLTIPPTIIVRISLIKEECESIFLKLANSINPQGFSMNPRHS